MLVRFLQDLWAGRHSAKAAYSANIFHVEGIEAAKTIILNPMPDMTTEERWEFETPRIVEELGRMMNPSTASRILDYGCGIGRVAKALIDRYGCSVVGVDISPEMRRLAPGYVQSDRFTACDPATLDRIIADGFRATGAYACWVLQHCSAPARDLDRIESALVPGASFFVMNSFRRWVPTDRGWGEDGVSIEELLAQRFETISKTGVSHLVGSEALAAECYAMLVERR